MTTATQTDLPRAEVNHVMALLNERSNSTGYLHHRTEIQRLADIGMMPAAKVTQKIQHADDMLIRIATAQQWTLDQLEAWNATNGYEYGIIMLNDTVQFDRAERLVTL